MITMTGKFCFVVLLLALALLCAQPVLSQSTDTLFLNALPTGLTLKTTHLDGVFTCQRGEGCFQSSEQFTFDLDDNYKAVGTPDTYKVTFFDPAAYNTTAAPHAGKFSNGGRFVIHYQPTRVIPFGTRLAFTVEMTWIMSLQSPPAKIPVSVSFGPVGESAATAQALLPFVLKATKSVFSEKNTSTFYHIRPAATTNHGNHTLGLDIKDFQFVMEAHIKNIDIPSNKFLIRTYGSLIIPEQNSLSDDQKVSCTINSIPVILTQRQYTTTSPFYHLLAEIPADFNEQSLPPGVDVLLRCSNILHVNTNGALYGLTVQFITSQIKPEDYDTQPQFTILSEKTNDDTTPNILPLTTSQYQVMVKPHLYESLHSNIMLETSVESKNTRRFSQYRYYIYLNSTNMQAIGKDVRISIFMQNVKDLDLVDDNAFYYFGLGHSHFLPNILPAVANYGRIHEDKGKNSQTITQSVFYWKDFIPTLHGVSSQDVLPKSGGYLIIDIKLQHINRKKDYSPPTFLISINQPIPGTTRRINLELATSISRFNKPVTRAINQLDFAGSRDLTALNSDKEGPSYLFNATINNLLENAVLIALDVAVREYEFSVESDQLPVCTINNDPVHPLNHTGHIITFQQQIIYFRYDFRAGQNYKIQCHNDVVLTPTFARRAYGKSVLRNPISHIPIHVFAFPNAENLSTGAFSWNYLQLPQKSSIWTAIIAAAIILVVLIGLAAVGYRYGYLWWKRRKESQLQLMHDNTLDALSLDAATAFGEDYDRLM